jgi:hypothetical protein
METELGRSVSCYNPGTIDRFGDKIGWSWKFLMKDPNVTQAILMRMPRLCRSALALVSKELTLVAARDLSDWRESAEDDVFGIFVNSNVDNCLGMVLLELQAVGAKESCCHGEDGMHTGEGFLEGGTILYSLESSGSFSCPGLALKSSKFLQQRGC